MAKKLQHLRGTYEEYRRIDPIPLEGEIALEEGADGYTRMKVGDGHTAYSSLPYLSGTVIEALPDSNRHLSLTLRHGYEYRSGVLSSLALSLPEKIREDYASTLVFDSFLSETTVSYPKEIVFFGDDCEGGLFLPKKRTRYTVTLNNRTGAIYACVRGVSHDLAYQSYYEVVKEVLPATAALKVEHPDRVLDVAVEGYLGYADTDGYLTGLGSYNWESESFLLKLRWQNGCILDSEAMLEQVKSTASYTLNSIGYSEEADGFSYLASTTKTIVLATSATQPLTSDFQYRLRARVALIGASDAYSVGDTIPSPFKVYYGTESYIPTMRYTGEGEFEIDFTTQSDKALTRLLCVGTGTEGRVQIRSSGFSLVACKGSYECEPTKRGVEATISLSAPLRSAAGVKDSYSLCSEQVTRRIQAEILRNYSVCYAEGNHAVFRCPLSVEMEPGADGELPYFERAGSVKELEEKPLHFYFDSTENGGTLYFSSEEGIYSESEMEDWIYSRYDILGYAYKKATPTVEEVALPCPLTPYEGYTFLMIESDSQGTFGAVYYENEENGEEL